jgi:hypothetical protein
MAICPFEGVGGVDEKSFPAEAGVALAAVRVEDPEHGPSPGRTEPVAGNERLGLLPDDVASEPDPGPSRQLEPEPGRLGHRSRQSIRIAAAGGLEDDEEHVRPAGESRHPMEPVGDLRRAVGRGEASRQVEQQEVDRAARQQGAGNRQALVERLGRDDDEPLEPDAAGDRLDRIEGAREVDPGDDRTGGLGFGHGAQGERRPAARAIAAQGEAGVARQAARAEDRVELGKPGRDDALERGERGARGGGLVRGKRQGAFGQSPRSCRSPASLETRQGRRHVRRPGGHAVIIEQTFYFVNAISAARLALRLPTNWVSA